MNEYQYSHHHRRHSHWRRFKRRFRKISDWFWITIGIFFLIFIMRQIYRHDHMRTESALFDGNLSGLNSKVYYDGIDVSHHQGIIDWPTVATDQKIKFVYVKATEGSTHVDSRYQANIREARKAGLLVGAYHFLTSKSPIFEQFYNFQKQLEMSQQDLLPMVDVEWMGVSGWTGAQLQDSLSLFVRLVYEYYGCDPVIYADAKFYKEYLGGWFHRYPLFIAHYHESQPEVEGASRYYIWQRDEHGHVAGIQKDVDLDVFTEGTTLDDIIFPIPVPQGSGRYP